ncbi:c-type cytochrome [Burkholderia gladioli]|uniref:Cytochrome C n=1 Tax=Burkholderia gladioli TaxID=28095 RepID=A0A2A7S1E2_BURGA|nr:MULTISPECIES: c-type cytochrome [Burkholderia]ATF86728.1 cytochrome C [Burkholderia gladioli pv. gladioli]MBJ9660155.1 c-type cytochrome [Burkholderia gladioli]MBJ9709574.1 c-type cytochrome [Burkholderia gladioli]MBU9159324.1 c-type cytochrome [Burkholderia gladioli]MBU9172689.1 c-type cytochrome [Burkholderia gladioli]
MNKHQPALRIAAAFALAACFATGAAHAADAARGKQLVESHNCAACHGTKFDNPINAEYPRLAGQRSDYLVWAMRQYQMGLDNPLLGRDNAIMRAQVQSLSVSDMQDIAAYLESLPGSLVFKK